MSRAALIAAADAVINMKIDDLNKWVEHFRDRQGMKLDLVINPETKLIERKPTSTEITDEH